MGQDRPLSLRLSVADAPEPLALAHLLAHTHLRPSTRAPGQALVVGSDIPGLGAEHLRAAAAALDTAQVGVMHDLCLWLE